MKSKNKQQETKKKKSLLILGNLTGDIVHRAEKICNIANCKVHKKPKVIDKE